MERRWFRIGSFLMILCIIDCVINYVVFKGTARSITHPISIGVIALLGVISAVLFPTSSIVLGHFLTKYGGIAGATGGSATGSLVVANDIAALLSVGYLDRYGCN